MNYATNLRNLHFGDIVNIVFYLFLISVAIVFSHQIKFWWLIVLFNLLLILFIVYVSVKWESSGNPDFFSAKRFIREWYLVPFILLTFKEIYFFINLLNLPDYDWILIKIDYILFGVHPTYVLSKIANPVLTEILQIAYSTFYFLPIILGYDFYQRGEIKKYRYVMGTIVYGFYLSYIGYLLVPAIGPRFTLHDFLKLDDELPGLFLTKPLRFIINTGESIPPGVPNPADYAQRDVFPSGHTQITLVIMYLSVVLNSKTKYFLIPTGILLIFSTVYLWYHYVIDLIAGFLFAAFTVATSPYLFNQCETKIGLRNAREERVQAVCSS
ncbi:MAG: phosphatase PAP2 family protein [Candidatus Kryptonium sp.]